MSEMHFLCAYFSSSDEIRFRPAVYALLAICLLLTVRATIQQVGVCAHVGESLKQRK